MSAVSHNPAHGDAVFLVEVSEDGLTATGEFRPAVGSGNPLDIEYVEDVLFQRDVSHNIDWFAIHKAIDSCNTTHSIINDVVIARGTPPEPQIPERLVVEPRFRRRQPVPGAVDKQTGAIDLRERHLLVVVQQGEQVARRIPPQEGKEGVSVSGVPIPVPVPKVAQPETGENVEEHDGVVTALVGGRLLFDDRLIEVHETLTLSDGVGYHTGHIRFPGHCVLGGAVRPGFRIRLGGSLHIKETVDVTEIYAEQQIVCDGGLLGHGEGVVRAKGRIRARFIENVTVESHKAVYIKQSCLYGKVRTLDRIVLGDKSRVVASELVAAHGVYAFSLGNEQGARVNVWAGINFVVERKIENLRRQVERLTLRITRLRTHLEGHENERARQRCQELEDQRSELQQKIGDLLGSLDSSEKAVVAVKDRIYPGTVVHICRAHFVVTEPLKGVEFRLNARAGVIEHAPLERGTFPKLQELEGD
ncbi:DUF342 domain-containing protein [Spirochaeta africana]|uniref:Putative polymerase with PALM domain, HD hydrolase domain and Zn ribbon n=1 Tax=Spirochaeta africana (strain ATCC 700263 / DSM 8902 / Z-7692) TaxID=889378 RepID=H9UFL2_SPIAZ|nr:FapA family protein [Spirochaeta africana]AFG36305.1 putative polymerase with PALM domain, HD hydrolase domain and Zn ribbon [Spirochaeta africana DSM 8902]